MNENNTNETAAEVAKKANRRVHFFMRPYRFL